MCVCVCEQVYVENPYTESAMCMCVYEWVVNWTLVCFKYGYMCTLCFSVCFKCGVYSSVVS